MYIVLLLLICSVLDGSYQLCNIPADSLVWQDDVSNATITIDGSSYQTCTRSGECGEEEDDKGLPLLKQLEPMIVQDGVLIRLSVRAETNRTNHSLYRVDIAAFVACNFDNSSLLSTAQNSDRFFNISPDVLRAGTNYFLLDTPELCDAGGRLNISVVTDHRCKNSSGDSPCSGDGHCVLDRTKDNFVCRCCTGFTGNYCEVKTVDTGPTKCGQRFCQNGGTCVTPLETTHASNSTQGENEDQGGGQGARCACSPHFTGPYCEVLLDHCKNSPCVHGVCVERINTYQCYCIPGFHGRRCQLEYNECLSTPCKNQGTCVDKVDRHECACTKGYTGKNCETKVDLCEVHPCHRNASCTDKGHTFTCSCPSGRTGRLCEIPVNECASSPCQNHGTCRDLDDGYQCLCPITFAGVHCEYMMDVFAPPLEGSDALQGKSHAHNLYVVAGTLSGAIVLILVVLAACYCKMHETYRQVTWRRLRHGHRSLSCPDFESCNEETFSRKHRLSVDAICEATNLSYDTTCPDSALNTPLNAQTI